MGLEKRGVRQSPLCWPRLHIEYEKYLVLMFACRDTVAGRFFNAMLEEHITQDTANPLASVDPSGPKIIRGSSWAYIHIRRILVSPLSRPSPEALHNPYLSLMSALKRMSFSMQTFAVSLCVGEIIFTLRHTALSPSQAGIKHNTTSGGFYHCGKAWPLTDRHYLPVCYTKALRAAAWLKGSTKYRASERQQLA